MSEISSILSKLKETRESEVLNSIEEAYKNKYGEEYEQEFKAN